MLANRFRTANEKLKKHGGRGKLIAFAVLLVITTFTQIHDAFPKSTLLSFLSSSSSSSSSSSTSSSSNHASQQRGPKNNNNEQHQREIAKKGLKTRRQNIESICGHDENATILGALVDQLEAQLSTIFTPPPPSTNETNIKNKNKNKKNNQKNDPVTPCMYTFIDLGANVGDSMGKFIEAGFPARCLGLDQMPRYSLEHGKMIMMPRATIDLAETAKKCFKDLSVHPEDYCYVGVEGNPVFTSRLEKLEAMVMATTPRPLQAAHFYTETVGTKQDGPTFLHLDTVNAHVNFWGSSILEAHPDVQKSSTNNATVKTPVMGLTLSTLLQRSVKKVPGAHVLIKMDIEGAEYGVMNQGMDALCSYTSAGVRVDLIMETHAWLGNGLLDYELFHNVTEKKLRTCNINSGQLSPNVGQ